jgi:hypothetical protein
MNKSRFFALGALGVLLVVPLLAVGATLRVGEAPSINAGEAVNDDVYLFGGSVSHSGSVSGDVIAGGGSILLQGSTAGDALLGGGTLTIVGSIGDDLRAGAGALVLTARVGGDLIAGGGQIQLSGEGVGGDALLGGGVVRLDAPVGGDVRIGGGEVYLNSSVGGGVEVDAERLTLGPAARLAGDLTYRGTAELRREEGSQVDGSIRFERREQGEGARGLFSLWLVAHLLMLLAGALFLGLFFRRFAQEMVHGAYEQPLREMGRGLVALILLPIVSILLVMSVVGVPFGILGLLAWVTLGIVACLTAPILLGHIIMRSIRTAPAALEWQSIALGVAVFYLVGFIPFLGWVLQAILTLAAAGSIARIKLSALQQWR